MTMFSDTIKSHVKHMVAMGKWDDLCRYLDNLSNSNFKSAKFVLESDVLLLVPSPLFWKAAESLVAFRPKSFLGSVSKIARARYNRKAWHPDMDALRRIGLLVSGEEAKGARLRFVRYLLPLMRQSGDIPSLFAAFGLTGWEEQTELLCECSSVKGFRVLFDLLRATPGVENSHVTACVRRLMKQGNDLSFNMASLLKTYFGLDEPRGVFALKVQPYELSYVEQSEEAFEKTLRRI